MSPLLKYFIITVLLFFAEPNLYAQKEPPPPGGRIPLPGATLPVDDHIIVLVFAGVIAGLFFYIKKSRQVKC